MKNIHRGDVYWAQLPDICGSVQRGTRPVIVISNNICNCHSSAISVIPVTTQEDNLSFLHIKIHGTPRTSYAMCEQVMTVDKQMLQSFIISVSDVDMKKIDQATGPFECKIRESIYKLFGQGQASGGDR